jgi:ABC-type Fe3+/spermidine/putrescine transport system ATPase subunit
MGEVEIHAVDGVDFEINEGEFVVIVGPSGAGKTTVLNILGGMYKATSGHVIVDGVDISSFNSIFISITITIQCYRTINKNIDFRKCFKRKIIFRNNQKS